jgi:arsenate reductase-like glutaredoxin family protein
MNIQIYAGKKNFDVQKAERYFKERKIPCQKVDLLRKGVSPGELAALIRSVGLEQLLDRNAPDYRSQNIDFHGLSARTESLILQYPGLLKTPIVRNGKQATVGYCPEIWQLWE